MQQKMTPTRKGRYTQCDTCVYKTKEDVKYPCSYSHKEIRQASGIHYERDFIICGLYKKVPFAELYGSSTTVVVKMLSNTKEDAEKIFRQFYKLQKKEIKCKKHNIHI